MCVVHTVIQILYLNTEVKNERYVQNEKIIINKIPVWIDVFFKRVVEGNGREAIAKFYIFTKHGMERAQLFFLFNKNLFSWSSLGAWTYYNLVVQGRRLIATLLIEHDNSVDDVIDSVISRSIRKDDPGSINSDSNLSVSRLPEWNTKSSNSC